MVMKEAQTTERCCKKVTQTYTNFPTETYICDKPATHTNGTHFFCRKHSKMGRFVIRVGDVGEILHRFDDEKMLRSEFDKLESKDGLVMQKITSSHRRTIN